MTNNKRLKSGLITLSSIIIAVASTPAWGDFVQFANTKLLGWGVPAVVTALLAVVLNEVWRHLINQSILKKHANKVSNASGTFMVVKEELY